MLSWLRGAAVILVLSLIGIGAGEVGARLDDRIFLGVPLTANPTFDGLFHSLDDGIRRGVPGARYKKVTFNNLGMRGPDLPAAPAPGCERWLFLGASETFGEPGLDGGDYPSHLRTLLPSGRCIEIVNSASPGLSLRTVTEQFDAYLGRIGASTVFVYPPTQFYLAELVDRRAPSAASLATPAGAHPAPGRDKGWRSGALMGSSRLFERLRDSAEIPAPIQRLRTRRWIDSALAAHPADWPFREVPRERLDAFDADITYLVERIRASGATPVLITHAIRVKNPPRPEDQADLFALRTYVPRAPADVMAAFEYAAAQRLRDLSRRLGVRHVDAAGQLSGRRELFIDAVHFSPDGNTAMAVLIRDAMLQPGAPPARLGAPDALQ